MTLSMTPLSLLRKKQNSLVAKRKHAARLKPCVFKKSNWRKPVVCAKSKTAASVKRPKSVRVLPLNVLLANWPNKRLLLRRPRPGRRLLLRPSLPRRLSRTLQRKWLRQLAVLPPLKQVAPKRPP